MNVFNAFCINHLERWRKESVEERINARIAVGENVGTNLGINLKMMLIQSIVQISNISKGELHHARYVHNL